MTSYWWEELDRSDHVSCKKIFSHTNFYSQKVEKVFLILRWEEPRILFIPPQYQVSFIMKSTTFRELKKKMLSSSSELVLILILILILFCMYIDAWHCNFSWCVFSESVLGFGWGLQCWSLHTMRNWPTMITFFFEFFFFFQFLSNSSSL